MRLVDSKIYLWVFVWQGEVLRRKKGYQSIIRKNMMRLQSMDNSNGKSYESQKMIA
jgi:hypothetical protein